MFDFIVTVCVCACVRAIRVKTHCIYQIFLITSMPFQAAILNLDNRERLNRVKNFSLEIKNREQMLQRQNFNATRLTKGAEENLKLSIANYDVSD